MKVQKMMLEVKALLADDAVGTWQWVVIKVQVPAVRMKFLVLTMMKVLAAFGSGGCVDEVLCTSGNDEGWWYWLGTMVGGAAGIGGGR